jgi:hypothetical protein
MRKRILTGIILAGVVVGLITIAMAAKKTEFLEFVTISKGYHSGIITPQNLIIKDNLTWKKIWNIHSKIRLPQPGLPDVDFAKEMVIAIFKGECPTGGYTTEIDSVEKVGDRIIVHIAETKPDPDNIVTQALTQPYHIIRTERTILIVEFVHKE